MGLENIFSQLNSGPKTLVHLSLTPGVGLELIQLDVSAHTVTNYAYRPVEYNESLRELSNMESFRNALIELFDELKISLKSNVILNLPMVLFGEKDLPLMLGDEAVNEALVSEVEQSYIFKRHDPVVSWFDSNNSKSNEVRRLFYSALQKNIIENIKSVFSELGLNLVNIEISTVSLMKALIFSGMLEDQTKDDTSWNLMIVNQNGYSICSMVGRNLVEYYEEPLAIRSFEGDEIYNAVNASAQITLMSYPASHLFIVSETDLVSAELLAKRIQVDCKVDFCENNNFKKQDYIPVSLEVIEENAHRISLQAIGVAVGNTVNLPFKLNFVGKSVDGDDDPNEPVHVELGAYNFDISPNAATSIAVVAAIVLLIPFIFIFAISPLIAKNKQKSLDDIAAKLKRVETEVQTLQNQQNKSNNFDIGFEMKKVLKDNRAKLMAYTALGEAVPEQLWLTYFVAKDDGKFNIKGEASNVEDIYLFFRNMKDSLVNTKLRVNKLEMISSSIEDAISSNSENVYYEFEITNMTNEELNPSAIPENKPEEVQDSKKDLLNKPLLNFGTGNQ